MHGRILIGILGLFKRKKEVVAFTDHRSFIIDRIPDRIFERVRNSSLYIYTLF